MRSARGLALFAAVYVHFVYQANLYADEWGQAQQIVNFFGSTCPSQGEWTRAATAQAASLIESLKALRDDGDCRTLAGSISQLNLLNQRIQALQTNSNQRSIYETKARQEALLLQLSLSQDPMEQEFLHDQLRQLQVQLAVLEGSEKYEDEYLRTKDADALENLVLSTDILLNQALAHQACLLKNPGLLSGFAAVGSSVWAALASSGTALAVSAGVDLMGRIIEWARNYKIQKAIGKMAKPVVQSAYLCVMESLSNQWCSAEEALKVLSLKANSAFDDSPLSEGINLLNHELPLFVSWLKSVRAGAEANTEGEAGRQDAALQREQSLRSARIWGLGIINENQDLYESASTDELKWAVVKSTVSKIRSRAGIVSDPDPYGYGGASTASPLSDIYSSSYSGFYLVGISQSEYQKMVQAEPYFSFDRLSEENWPSGSAVNFPPDLNLIKNRLLAWIEIAEQKVAEEKDLVVQPDPLRVFVEAVSPRWTGSGRRGISVYTASEKIQDFLTERLEDVVQPLEAKLYKDTLTSISSIVEKIQEAERISDDRKPADFKQELREILNEIYDLAELEFGTSVIQKRMEYAVRRALIQVLVDDFGGSESNLAAQLLAAEDVVKELERFSFTSSHAQIRADIENSQRITDEVLLSFADIFQENLKDTVLYFRTKALEEQRQERWGPYKNGFGQMCLSLLAVPSWDTSRGWGRNLKREYCLNAQVKSLYPQAPHSKVIEEATFDRPQAERACLLRNFYRQQRIYQDALPPAGPPS